MFVPVKDGMKKGSGPVSYQEAKLPHELSYIVDSYWHYVTECALCEGFVLHPLGNASVKILFN